MRFPFLLACILALACFSAAAIDVCAVAVGNKAPEPIFPKTSRLAVLLEPLRGVLDVFFKRAPHKSKKETDRQPWTISTHASYAHKVDDGWRVHIHGNLHHRQPYDEVQLNKILNSFLLRTRLKVNHWKFWQMNYHTLTEDELARGRPLAHDIASVPICHGTIGARFDTCNEGSILPVATNDEGSFYGTTTVSDSCALRTNRSTIDIPHQKFTLVPCNLRSKAMDNNVQNTAEVLFVPPRGVTVIANIDDILRVTNVWNPKQALLNVFVRKFKPWRDMADVLYDLKYRIEAEGQNVHFHYLTDAPEVIASSYTNHMLDYFPQGSFDFRPLNFTKTREMLHARKFNVQRLLESFPERRFISLGDTTNAMNRFPKDMNSFYPRLQCILIRDTVATERSNWVIPDTRDYFHLDDTEYLFFRTPADLKRLSGRHLASLAPQVDGAPRTIGCFDSNNKLDQAMQPSHSRWFRIKSLAKLSWWNIKCAVIWPSHRPNQKCPLDRLEGTVYHDGKVEPVVKPEPFTDHMPYGEWPVRKQDPADKDNKGEEEKDDPKEEDKDKDDTEKDDKKNDDPENEDDWDDKDDPEDEKEDDEDDWDEEEDDEEGHDKKDHDGHQ